ncbi:MAG TPA: hypothetical protein PKX74_07130 [Leptospiraceae bacterium]|nr:hypothetical protein [Leptospiraceae bacterium]HMY45232.1 hypothetical protein [Leptospiraceae bacterium]
MSGHISGLPVYAYSLNHSGFNTPLPVAIDARSRFVFVSENNASITTAKGPRAYPNVKRL